MTLQARLDAFKADFEAKAPAPAIEAFHRSTRELIVSGIAKAALQAGQTAPEFSLNDPDGNLVSSGRLLAQGPLVVTFYRGVWCPYCNLELQALEEAAEEIRARGANLVAVSMQNASSSRKSQRENKLSFPILTDKGGEVAEQFGLKWAVQDYVIEFFKGFGVDLPAIHDDGAWNLPMPARYVIAGDGTIQYAEVNPDYTQRPEPSDLFPVLERLARSAA